jgi:hypothetical protein
MNAWTLYIIGFDPTGMIPTIDGVKPFMVHSKAEKLAVNFGVVALFYLQHAGMPRNAFKDFMLKATDNQYIFFMHSFFLLGTAFSVFTMIFAFQPMPEVIYEPTYNVKVAGAIVLSLFVFFLCFTFYDMRGSDIFGKVNLPLFDCFNLRFLIFHRVIHSDAI